MQRFKLGFRNKSALEQLTFCEQTVQNLDAHRDQHFDPSQITDASDTVAAMRASHERIASLRSELKMEVTRRNQLLREARTKVTLASLGASIGVGGDPAKLRAVGLELEKPKTVPIGKPDAPDHLHAEPTAKEGEVWLSWRRSVRRCIFNIECRPDNEPDGWKQIDSSFQQKCVIEGLVSGVKYWFRIRATNAHGTSAWSGLATARVK